MVPKCKLSIKLPSLYIMIYKGNRHEDERGIVTFNNNFDASAVKRIYTLENHDTHFIRGWQGHKNEQRWFTAISGSFEVRLICIDDWETPTTSLEPEVYRLEAGKLDVLHVPAGYITSIQALEKCSKLLVMADFGLGEIEDDYRFPADYFEN